MSIKAAMVNEETGEIENTVMLTTMDDPAPKGYRFTLPPKKPEVSESLFGNGEHGEFEGPYNDLIISEYRRKHTWAPNTINELVDFLGDRGTFIDVGANIGLFSIPVAKRTGAVVHSFEPSVTNLKYLDRNIKAHDVDNIIVYDLALFDRTSSLTMEYSPDHTFDCRLKLESNLSLMGEDDWKHTSVLARALDDLKIFPKKPVAMKMDAQGAEPFVIAGGRETLQKVDYISTEFSPYWMYRMGSDANVLIDFLSEFDSVRISQCEKEEFGEAMTGEEARMVLTDMYETHKSILYAGNELWAYWNVIATR